ncbi:hypothetical protein BDZ89DRAFT_1233063 [Hymenopellis radicata]|nr:hypothetical protein BDZ89DRAFT_1233063 [Hymenopellis radicata]
MFLHDWIESYAIDGTLRTVLSHNNELTSLQATSVASSKEYLDLAHGRITQDIDNLENALELMRARRHALNRLSIQHAGALSAFRRLPNEILSEIFLYACGEERFRVACLHEGPWKLRTVCQKWASIVEGCSQLWCNMFIDVAHEDVDPAAFAQALQYCGSRPIHMTLSVNERYGRVRWDFHEVWDTSYPPLRDGTLLLSLPLLRTLKLEGAEYYKDLPMSPPTLSALLTAPLLETVHLDLFGPEDIAQLLNILPFHVNRFDNSCATQAGTSQLRYQRARLTLFPIFAYPFYRGPDNKPEKPHFEDDESVMVFKRALDMLLVSRCSLVSLALSYTVTLVDEFLQILAIVPTLEILDMRVAWSEGAMRDEVLCKFFTALLNRRNNTTFSFLPALQNLRLGIAAPGWICNDERDYRFGLAGPRHAT